jgi:hypothetical protein
MATGYAIRVSTRRRGKEGLEEELSHGKLSQDQIAQLGLRPGQVRRAGKSDAPMPDWIALISVASADRDDGRLVAVALTEPVSAYFARSSH